MERGASIWLTALPIADFCFALTKGDFRDALCLRYGWQPARLPTTCVCGKPFSAEHAMNCLKGGFVGQRHNEVLNLLGSLLDETCNNGYRQHEKKKRRMYEERVREVERGTFTPLVFSCFGGSGPAATVFLKRLASLLALKRDIPYSCAMHWLLCRISFALVRSQVLCLRGSRLRYGNAVLNEPLAALSAGAVSQL